MAGVIVRANCLQRNELRIRELNSKVARCVDCEAMSSRGAVGGAARLWSRAVPIRTWSGPGVCFAQVSDKTIEAIR